MERKTSFGSLEVLLERDGKVKSELLKFARQGRPHAHAEVEVCYVTEGRGVIICGEEEIAVEKGDVCNIPPHTPHYMRPEGFMEILLVYHNRPLG